jgi:hypothetical protein
VGTCHKNSSKAKGENQKSMKSIIKRFWGVGLIVIILSSMFVAAVPVTAGNYAFTADTTQPTTANKLLGPAGYPAGSYVGIMDEAQTADGTTIYAITANSTTNSTNSGSLLYTSTNGGVTWAPCTGAQLPPFFDMVAVAPDSASILVVVNTITRTVYLSTNGGASFSALTATGLATINDVSVSALSGPSRYIAIAGNTAAATAGSAGAAVLIWTYGSAAPVWYNILTGGGSPAWTALAVNPDDA